MTPIQIEGNIIDIPARRIYPGRVTLADGRIQAIESIAEGSYSQYVLPGFIDAHVHVESSMLAPSEFARMATVHGTVATISDPHEIANVLGLEGVRFMVNNGNAVPFHFFFGAPSCVPATTFETAGAALRPADIRTLLEQDGREYLSEMMNFPGVLHQQPDVMEKLAIAKLLHRPIDGHAPGLRGDEARRYAEAGITTDHECFTLDEALDKIHFGMTILIREGSAAKNFDALHPLIAMHPTRVMFCSDDKHPNELAQGHINLLVKRAVVEHDYDLFHVLHAACLAPIDHYGLNVGRLRVGDRADLIVIEDIKDFRILQTYVSGQLVSENGHPLISSVPITAVNNFDTSPKKPSDFTIKATGPRMRVIEVLDGQIVTNAMEVPTKIVDGLAVPDVPNDILKLTVVNRYHDAPPAVAFVKNFGLSCGALASCIAHDSHNIIAVGCSDEELCQAVNYIIEDRGGICAVGNNNVSRLPLPLAGIMSIEDAWKVAALYKRIDSHAKQLGTKLHAPFMSLSFLALLVIPSLKLSDKGLFDVNTFNFTELMLH